MFGAIHDNANNGKNTLIFLYYICMIVKSIRVLLPHIVRKYKLIYIKASLPRFPVLISAGTQDGEGAQSWFVFRKLEIASHCVRNVSVERESLFATFL
jgi:hypothetical protein